MKKLTPAYVSTPFPPPPLLGVAEEKIESRRPDPEIFKTTNNKQTKKKKQKQKQTKKKDQNPKKGTFWDVKQPHCQAKFL